MWKFAGGGETNGKKKSRTAWDQQQDFHPHYHLGQMLCYFLPGNNSSSSSSSVNDPSITHRHQHQHQ